MEIIVFLFLFLVSLVAGIVLTLAVQWYLFSAYIMKQPVVGPPSKPNVTPFSLPKGIIEEKCVGNEPASLNSLLQFLFQECRNSKRVRQWFRHRLSLELEELLTRTTTGKLFERIVLRDLNLGSHLPAIKNIEVKSFVVDPETKMIEEVELCLDLDYSGGFQLSIDASMRLSKMAHVSVTVNELSGQAMLKFTRNPYTHWCFSFYSDPQLQLSVESQFQGRTLPHVNSIIANQIRKALKRNHTIPNYKIRYKPFFVRTELENLVEDDKLEPTAGNLEVTILEVTRIVKATGPIFCSVAVDKLAWIEMVQSGTSSYLTVDAFLTKQSGQQLPIVFKQEFVPDKYQVGVVVESVNSVGGTELKPGDIVIMADGKKITSLSALNRIIKASPSKFVLRVERKLKAVVPLNEDKGEQFGLRHRSGSGDKTDSDSSSPPSLSESPAKRSLKGSPEHAKENQRLSLTADETDTNRPQVYTTKDVPYTSVITFNETLKFQISKEHRYLNLSVWSRNTDKNTLLGHLSLPVATHCPKNVGHYISTFSLFPPSPNFASLGHSLSSHSGFEPCLCYGDVLLSFSFSSTSTPVSSQPPPPVTITTPPESPADPTPPPIIAEAIGAEHQFVRTHFERVTQCGFCFKKIWLKDALQCEDCLMSCHKKCASKCQNVSGCAKSVRRPSIIQPEIITTSPEDSNTQSGRSLSTLLASVTPRGLKRAGSATNLAPPGIDSTTPGASISLPPSPNHSPSPSRKASLVEGGLFNSSDVGGDDINQALDLLLSRPHDENVMDAAKASGKLLFADLPPDLRKSRIDSVISKLREAMDAESQNHESLIKEEQSSDNPSAKARLAFLSGKSEERLQALTVLMLHCCAGLQDHQESAN